MVPYVGRGNALTGRVVTNCAVERIPEKIRSPGGTLSRHQGTSHKPEHPYTDSPLHVLPPPPPPYALLLSPDVLRYVDTYVPMHTGRGTNIAAGSSRLPYHQTEYQGTSALPGLSSTMQPQCATVTTSVHSGRMCVCVSRWVHLSPEMCTTTDVDM